MSENKTTTSGSHGAEDEQARGWDGWEEAKAESRHALDRLDRVLVLDEYEGGSFVHHA